jgi:tetratricopeptide (TPR) repeat protein
VHFKKHIGALTGLGIPK